LKILGGILAALIAGGLGLPMPEELPLLAAGAAVWRGAVPVGLVAATCLLGLLTGDSILFFFGRHGGPRVARLVKPERLARIERHFARHSARTLVFARFAPGARAVFFLCAGASRMPFARFLAEDAIGAALGTAVWLTVGFLFGADLEQVRMWISRYHRVGTIVLVVVGLVGVMIVRLRASRARSPNPP
jgi:membrane protein DedA with SNARE-associated domain